MAIPMTKTLETVPRPGRWRSGIHRSSTAAPTTIDTTPTGHEFRITASFGVVDSDRAGHDFNQLLARVDEAMYRAKNAGRDRVEMVAEAT